MAWRRNTWECQAGCQPRWEFKGSFPEKVVFELRSKGRSGVRKEGKVEGRERATCWLEAGREDGLPGAVVSEPLLCSFIHPFIQSSPKYWLSACSRPGTVLGTGDTKVGSKTDKVPSAMELTIAAWQIIPKLGGTGAKQIITAFPPTFEVFLAGLVIKLMEVG